MEKLSDRQTAILRHARGWPDNYRNHFVAGGEDDTECRALVDLGLMWESRQPSEITGGSSCFSVTTAGDDAIRKAA